MMTISLYSRRLYSSSIFSESSVITTFQKRSINRSIGPMNVMNEHIRRLNRFRSEAENNLFSFLTLFPFQHCLKIMMKMFLPTESRAIYYPRYGKNHKERYSNVPLSVHNIHYQIRLFENRSNKIKLSSIIQPTH